MQIYDGLESLADNYDAFIFDVWGVLHNGVRAYPGVSHCLKQLKTMGKDVLLLSNSPNRAHYMPIQLSRMGIEPDLYGHVVTSGESTYKALKTHEGKRVFCISPDEHPTCMEDLDLKRVSTPEEADFALISHPGLGRADDYLDTLRRCLDKDMEIICANPDKVVDVGGTLYLCAGGVCDLYEDMGGRVNWHGKPYVPVYDWAFDLLGTPQKSRVLAVGDSIRTDVTGAKNYGIDVLWNAVGIHWEEISANGSINADKVNQYFTDDPNIAKPTGILNGLSW